MEAFAAEPSETAYERLVDHWLVASPEYGEQWGRHWLDVVRFGESLGLQPACKHEELTLAVRLIQKHGLRAFARALRNSYEFLYHD